MKDAWELAGAMVAVAALGMIIANARGTSQVVGAVTGGFNNLLQTIQLRGSGSYRSY